MKRESIYDQMTYAEKEVAKVLKEFQIQWAYEQPVFVCRNCLFLFWYEAVVPDRHLYRSGVSSCVLS